MEKKFLWNSPYAFSENRVNDGVEFEGLQVLLIGEVGSVGVGIKGIAEGGVIYKIRS